MNIRTFKKDLAELKPFWPGTLVAAALVLIPLSVQFLTGMLS